MVGPRYGRKWRGFPWAHWEKTVKIPTIANLRTLIERYDQTSTLAFPPTLMKHEMIELAMVTLDEHSPSLNYQQVMDAFRVFLTANVVEISHQPPHFGNVPQGRVFAPNKPITSNQLELRCIREAQTAIQRFLRAVYHQSWQLYENCLPYFPAQPLSGGHIIDSDTALQRLLGSLRNPEISLLFVDVRPSPDGDVQYAFSKSGQTFPCRGRGPVWKENSCALDCIIVAARLLNLGRTVADKGTQRRSEWAATLPLLVRHFTGLIAHPWEWLDDTTSQQYRWKFLTQFLEMFNNPNSSSPAQIGDFLPAISIWQLSTAGMLQTSFSTYAYTSCSDCHTEGPNTTIAATTHRTIPLVQMNDTVKKKIGERPSMSDLLNLFFGAYPQRNNCIHCSSRGTVRGWRAVHGDLPARLAILPDRSYRDVVGATSPSIKIRYSDTMGASNEVNYRWLGGIYQAGNHYRLYWIDCGPNEQDNGLLRVYDGMNLKGSIIGGVTPGELNAKVPPYWSKGADILFYERVEPSITMLQYAAEAIKRGVDFVVTEELKPSQTAQSNPDQPVQIEGPQPVESRSKRKRSDEETTSKRVRRT
ncbi:hypothetical protein MMC29_000111 [Sticta canariensis]|nr:hypothetical protein [Sticta canariensis]